VRPGFVDGPAKGGCKFLHGKHRCGRHAESLAELHPVDIGMAEIGQGGRSRAGRGKTRPPQFDPDDVVAPVGADQGCDIEVLPRLRPEGLECIQGAAVGLKIDNGSVGAGHSGPVALGIP